MFLFLSHTLPNSASTSGAWSKLGIIRHLLLDFLMDLNFEKVCAQNALFSNKTLFTLLKKKEREREKSALRIDLRGSKYTVGCTYTTTAPNRSYQREQKLRGSAYYISGGAIAGRFSDILYFCGLARGRKITTSFPRDRIRSGGGHECVCRVCLISCACMYDIR